MPDAMLAISNLDAFYGDFQALFGVSLELRAGEILAAVGANGAGKSTLLRCIVGLNGSEANAIRFRGEPIGAMPANLVVQRGIALVPEGRRLFPSLSVEENIMIGGRTKRPGPWAIDAVYRLFPALRDRRNAPPKSLSGGQQQMVAIARALMSNPDLILLDELSLGLAPVVIRDIYKTLPAIVAEGTSAILVEQDITRALATADRVICLQEGRVRLSGKPANLSRAEISAAYFGYNS
jgi:branched-chain amino acid transport system ATP-binding protein